MGNSSSCIHWFYGSEGHSSENEPFLSETQPKPARTFPQAVADVAAALKGGKLPSQTQIDNWARDVLKSDILSFPLQQHGQLSPEAMRVVLDMRNFLEILLVFGLEKNSDDKLQELVYEISQLDSTVLKRPSVDGTDVVESVSDEVPSVSELDDDLATVLLCCRSLSSVLFRSATFHTLLSSFMFLLRRGVATAAESVNQVAHQVEATANAIETVAGAVEKVAEEIHETAQPNSVEEATASMDLNTLQAGAKEIVASAVEQVQETQSDQITPRTDKTVHSVSADDVFVQQIYDVLVEVQQRPQYISDLQVLLNIARKYVDRIALASNKAKTGVAETAQSFMNDTRLSPKVDGVLANLKVSLERFAGSTQSLDKVLLLAQDILLRPRNSEWWSYLGECLESAQVVVSTPLRPELAGEDYFTATTTIDDLRALFGKWKILNSFDRDPRITMLLQELSAFTTALQQDRTLNRFIATVRSLSTDTTHYFRSVLVPKASGNAKSNLFNLSDTFWNDLRVYIIPKLFFGAIKLLWRPEQGMPLPLPRVEFVEETLDGVFDPRFTTVSSSLKHKTNICCNLFMSTEEVHEGDSEEGEEVDWSQWLIPSTIRLQQRNDTEIDMSSGAQPSTSNTIRLQFNGIFSADSLKRRIIQLRGMLFYVNYKGLLAYEDEGALDLDIDFDLGGLHGADLEVELEVNTATGEEQIPAKPPFLVRSVHFVPPDTIHFRPDIRQSKHWIVNNAVVNPLGIPVVKLFLKRYLGQMLEAGIREGLQSLGDLLFQVSAEARSRNEHQRQKSMSASTTTPVRNWWGAILDTLSSKFSGSEEVTTETTVSVAGVKVHRTKVAEQGEEDSDQASTTIAVGVVPQLVPDKAVPADASQEVVDELSRTAQTVRDNVEDRVAQGAEAFELAQSETSQALRRFEDKRAEEARRNGWRSSAFG